MSTGTCIEVGPASEHSVEKALLPERRHNRRDAREVSVVVQQCQVGLHGGLRDETIDAGADGHASPPAVEVNSGCGSVTGNRLVESDETLPAEIVPQTIIRCRIAGALQDLHVHEIGDADSKRVGQQFPHEVDVGVVAATDVVDPHGRVHQVHGAQFAGARSAL